MLHAYCVRRASEPAPPPELKGVDGAAVYLVGEGELALWVSSAEPNRAPELERLRAHDRVVRAALATATPLPIRLGAHFQDEVAARAALRERATEFLEALRRVEHRVEMAVRVEWGAEAPLPDPVPTLAVSSGREYLEMRRRQLEAGAALGERARRELDAVADFFADLDLPTVRNLLPDSQSVGSLAHLVHRNQIDQYRERARAARQQLSRLNLSLSGPWAPYSFV